MIRDDEMAARGLKRLIVTSLVVGGLLALAPIGQRGYHFFPVFILMSGFVLGVGVLVNEALRRLPEKQKNLEDD
jgi:hypothetical protein